MGCFTRVTCGSQCPGCTGREEIPRICTILCALYHKRARLNIGVTRFIMTQSPPPSKTFRLLSLVVPRPIRSLAGTSAPPQFHGLHSPFWRLPPSPPTTTCFFYTTIPFHHGHEKPAVDDRVFRPEPPRSICLAIDMPDSPPPGPRQSATISLKRLS